MTPWHAQRYLESAPMHELSQGPGVISPRRELELARRLLQVGSDRELDQFLPLIPLALGAAKSLLPAAAKLALPALSSIGRRRSRSIRRRRIQNDEEGGFREARRFVRLACAAVDRVSRAGLPPWAGPTASRIVLRTFGAPRGPRRRAGFVCPPPPASGIRPWPAEPIVAPWTVGNTGCSQEFASSARWPRRRRRRRRRYRRAWAGSGCPQAGRGW